MRKLIIAILGTATLLFSCKNPEHANCKNGGEINCNGNVGMLECACRCQEDWEDFYCDRRTGEVISGDYQLISNNTYFYDYTTLTMTYFNADIDLSWSAAEQHRIYVRMIMIDSTVFADAGDTCYFNFTSVSPTNFQSTQQPLINTGDSISSIAVTRFANQETLYLAANIFGSNSGQISIGLDR